MKKTEETKTVSLRPQTLKELTVEDLRRVAGGLRKSSGGNAAI